VPGLERLRRKFIVAALSNGNMALLVNMAKYAGLPWDCVLSAELARRYKPAPEVYLTAVDLLGLEPSEVLMVAAHAWDLQGAQAAGLCTAFIQRSPETVPVGRPANVRWDVEAGDFNELADQLESI
jgi:2-haloacid dehalogenase